MAERGAKL